MKIVFIFILVFMSVIFGCEKSNKLNNNNGIKYIYKDSSTVYSQYKNTIYISESNILNSSNNTLNKVLKSFNINKSDFVKNSFTHFGVSDYYFYSKIPRTYSFISISTDKNIQKLDSTLFDSIRVKNIRVEHYYTIRIRKDSTTYFKFVSVIQ